MTIIFCPTCDTLVLTAPSCPDCGWQRPREIGDAGRQLWRVELGRALPKPRASAVVAGERYCLSAEDGTIVALDLASGQMAWERQIDAGHTTHVLATDGTQLFVSSVDTQPIPTNGRALLALDAATGQDIWRYTTLGHSLSAAALADGVAYFSSSDGMLHAVDAASGQARWQVRHASWGPDAPAAGNGVVCVGGRGDALVAYAIHDGTEQWRFAAAAWFASPLCLAEDQLYALNWDCFLYALETRTGRLRWKRKGERGQGFTSPPAADSSRLYVGSRVYQDRDGAHIDAYALLALRTEDGGEDWRFSTPKHIVAPPALAGDSVLFSSEDGFFYALDTNTGIERWKIESNGRIVTQPQLAGDIMYIGERHGAIYAIRWRAEQNTQPNDPESYRRAGALEFAAEAYALRGEFDIAATIFETELGHPREAALLYERAGQPAQAAARWEAAGDARRARDLYQQSGDLSGVARMLDHMGEPLQAAKLYQEIGQPDLAAQLYEQAGDRVKAAELYHLAGKFDQAMQIWKSLDQWERLVEAIIADGNQAEAARILEQHEQHDRAADLYEAAGQLQPALRLRVELQHWERAANLAFRAENYEQEARAYERLGQALSAAAAYERAAQQCLSRTPASEEHVAMYYEQAAQQYDIVFDEQQATRCHGQVRRYRHLPEIAVSGGAQNTFVEYEWNTLKLRIRNTGHGPAANIITTLRGAFDISGNRDIASLAPKKTATLDLSLRPQHEQYGPAVPLEILVNYTDARGGQYSVSRRIPIRVMQQGAAFESTTPLEINIQREHSPRNAGRVGEASLGEVIAIAPRMLAASAEEIEQQQNLLAIHRRNLAHYLEQQAKLGAAFIPPGLSNGIFEERDNIWRVKRVLRDWGVVVKDHPDDSSGTTSD